MISAEKINECVKTFVFERPQAVRSGIMRVLSSCIKKISGYYKNSDLADAFVMLVQSAINDEYFKRTHSHGNYQRIKYPPNKKIPKPRDLLALPPSELDGVGQESLDMSNKISDLIRVYLNDVSTEETTQFLAQLLVSYSFTCPEILLKSDESIIGQREKSTISEFELVYSCWVAFHYDLDELVLWGVLNL